MIDFYEMQVIAAGVYNGVSSNSTRLCVWELFLWLPEEEQLPRKKAKRNPDEMDTKFEEPAHCPGRDFRSDDHMFGHFDDGQYGGESMTDGKMATICIYRPDKYPPSNGATPLMHWHITLCYRHRV